mmetsp:Transcript_23436/g.59803  ORF Transcript_23436/g.59803 Transcript_23436/m.59803 type:complete len:271 (+) Transcript_23436:983-1795(+)
MLDDRRLNNRILSLGPLLALRAVARRLGSGGRLTGQMRRERGCRQGRRQGWHRRHPEPCRQCAGGRQRMRRVRRQHLERGHCFEHPPRRPCILRQGVHGGVERRSHSHRIVEGAVHEVARLRMLVVCVWNILRKEGRATAQVVEQCIEWAAVAMGREATRRRRLGQPRCLGLPLVKRRKVRERRRLLGVVVKALVGMEVVGGPRREGGRGGCGGGRRQVHLHLQHREQLIRGDLRRRLEGRRGPGCGRRRRGRRAEGRGGERGDGRGCTT